MLWLLLQEGKGQRAQAPGSASTWPPLADPCVVPLAPAPAGSPAWQTM